MSISGFVMLTMMPVFSPAAAWEEYVYLDRGVAIQFPVNPEASTAPYPSALVKGLTSTIYTAQDDNVIYKLTIVDLAGHTDAATNLLNVANYSPPASENNWPHSEDSLPHRYGRQDRRR